MHPTEVAQYLLSGLDSHTTSVLCFAQMINYCIFHHSRKVAEKEISQLRVVCLTDSFPFSLAKRAQYLGSNLNAAFCFLVLCDKLVPGAYTGRSEGDSRTSERVRRPRTSLTLPLSLLSRVLVFSIHLYIFCCKRSRAVRKDIGVWPEANIEDCACRGSSIRRFRVIGSPHPARIHITLPLPSPIHHEGRSARYEVTCTVKEVLT